MYYLEAVKEEFVVLANYKTVEEAEEARDALAMDGYETFIEFVEE